MILRIQASLTIFASLEIEEKHPFRKGRPAVRKDIFLNPGMHHIVVYGCCLQGI